MDVGFVLREAGKKRKKKILPIFQYVIIIIFHRGNGWYIRTIRRINELSIYKKSLQFGIINTFKFQMQRQSVITYIKPVLRI